MDSGGGAVVVAAGSEIVQSTIGSTITKYRKWFRLYSDGWCEQGGLCKDDTVEQLHIPYSDLYFNVVLSSRETAAGANFPWWVDTVERNYEFTPRIGADRTGGPAIYADFITRGYVSQETVKQVLSGKEWDPSTESWN